MADTPPRTAHTAKISAPTVIHRSSAVRRTGLYDAPVTFRCVCLGGLVLALLAGCSQDDPPASTLPPLSVAPSPSAPSAEPVPTAAQAATPQGAAEFARFFYGEIVQAFKARDPDRIAILSASDCEACQAYVDSLTSLRDENESVRFDIVVVAAEAPGGDTTNTARVTVIYNSEGSIRYNANGTEIAREPARRNAEQTLTLVRTGGTWKVQEVTSQ